MLKIRKVIFDNQGHVNMTLSHYGYDIRVYSRPYTENIIDICEEYGEFVQFKTHHDDYSNSKSFKGRCYDVSTLNITYNSGWEQRKLNWFIRHTEVSDKAIQDLFSGKIFFYDIHVIVSKYGVGLSAVNSCDEMYDFYKVSTKDRKADLITLINNVIAEGYEDARGVEPDIFNSHDSVDYSSDYHLR